MKLHGTLKEPSWFKQNGGNIKMYKQDVAYNEYTKFTREELLSIFKVEAQHICKSPVDVQSISDSALNDFIKCHGKYVRFT